MKESKGAKEIQNTKLLMENVNEYNGDNGDQASAIRSDIHATIFSRENNGYAPLKLEELLAVMIDYARKSHASSNHIVNVVAPRLELKQR